MRVTVRFREARAAAKVKSEHACRVFDVGRLENGSPYLVMEYLEGVDLGEKVSRDGPQPSPGCEKRFRSLRCKLRGKMVDPRCVRVLQC